MAGFNQYRRVLTIPTGDPFKWHGNTDGLNGVGLLEPGELGGVLPWQGEQFQLVKMDSGATATPASGIPAIGEIAFWKDRSNYLVTNDSTQADAASTAGAVTKDPRNSVAGVIEMAVVAGEFFFVHQKGNSNVKTSSTPVPGDVLVANTGTSADCGSVTAGTAPTSQEIGIVTSATKTGGLIPAKLVIQFID